MTSATETTVSVEDGPEVEESPRPSPWREHGPALTGYVLLTAVCFWPVAGHLRTRILSDGGDGAAYLWNLWALPRAVLGGHNPFDTHDLFFPVGAHTAFNTNMPLVAIVSWPLPPPLSGGHPPSPGRGAGRWCSGRWSAARSSPTCTTSCSCSPPAASWRPGAGGRRPAGRRSSASLRPGPWRPSSPRH